MVIKSIDAAMLKKAFITGAAQLEAKKEIVNELNVFPVPDGDTGTNMTLTIMSAVKEVNNIEDFNMKTLCKAMSSGSLRGARGNSGVILSQLLRGFCSVMKEKEVIDVPAVNAAFEKAVESAYKAVMKPKEGTILTVAKAGATKALELADQTDDLVYYCGEIVKYMEEVLAKTPDMLPVLKEAGVVDSGGQGLLEVMKGAYDGMLGKELDLSAVSGESNEAAPKKTGITDDIETADIKFGYCTEFIILTEKEFTSNDEREFKSFLEGIGDCVVVVADDGVVKVHVHTNNPGVAIEKALTFGQLTSMKIDNMREEHNERVIMNAEKEASPVKEEEKSEPAGPRKSDGFIAVSAGAGLSGIFKELGVDYIIEGGQTMNPSTEDMLSAIAKVNADNIFILPNNKNIVMAANQARDLTEDKHIVVIPTATVPQGIAAVINFIAGESADENEARMLSEIKNIKTGQVTYAVRDTSIDGKEIKMGNIMGLDDKTIKAVGEDIKETTLELLRSMIDEDAALVSIYYGDEMSEESANEIADAVGAEFDYVDIEVHNGGQPIYYYILSVE